MQRRIKIKLFVPIYVGHCPLSVIDIFYIGNIYSAFGKLAILVSSGLFLLLLILFLGAEMGCVVSVQGKRAASVIRMELCRVAKLSTSVGSDPSE